MHTEHSKSFLISGIFDSMTKYFRSLKIRGQRYQNYGNQLKIIIQYHEETDTTFLSLTTLHSSHAFNSMKSVLNHFVLYLYFRNIYSLQSLNKDILLEYISHMYTINKRQTVIDNITKIRWILAYAYKYKYTNTNFSILFFSRRNESGY